MCKCLDQVKTDLKERVQEKIKTEIGFQEIKDFDFVNKVWLLLDNDLSPSESKAPFTIPMQVKYTRKAKNGNVREYKKTINFIPSCCPVCGEKYGGT